MQVIAKLSLFLNLIRDKKKTLQLYNFVILSLSLFNHWHSAFAWYKFYLFRGFLKSLKLKEKSKTIFCRIQSDVVGKGVRAKNHH